jgi:hypothetical protein
MAKLIVNGFQAYLFAQLSVKYNLQHRTTRRQGEMTGWSINWLLFSAWLRQEFRTCHSKKRNAASTICPRRRNLDLSWWSWTGSNRRPLECHSGKVRHQSITSIPYRGTTVPSSTTNQHVAQPTDTKLTRPPRDELLERKSRGRADTSFSRLDCH